MYRFLMVLSIRAVDSACHDATQGRQVDTNTYDGCKFVCLWGIGTSDEKWFVEGRRDKKII